MVSLVVEDVRVRYATSSGQGLVALDGLDLSVAAGEVVSIIGPSGCGKSTLLHCMGGLLKPTAGKVTFEGASVTRPRPDALSFVFQEYSLFPWKTVVENAAIGLRFARMSKRERRARAAEQLRVVGLADFLDAYPGELSGGMQQRVAVARALAMNPAAVLMDEPFGALDEMSRRSIGLEISRVLSEEGKTVVLITHSLDEAIFWADRVIVMSARPGQIVDQLRVDEPRPRTLDMMLGSRFGEIRSALLGLLEPSHRAEVTREDATPANAAAVAPQSGQSPSAHDRR